MAKKSEIIGEYIVTIDDNNSVSVSRIYKSTKAALSEIAVANGIEVLNTWTTQYLGRLLLSKFCEGATEGKIGEYEIQRDPNGRINVIRTYSNTMKGLGEVVIVAGFPDDPKDNNWNTQTYGRKIVNFAQQHNS